jgi:hypothetical protein
MSAPLLDFLALGPLVQAKLRETLPPQVFVLDSKDLASITEQQQPAPAVHVLFGGFMPRAGNAAWEELEQRWITVIVVRNVASLPGAASSELDAGPLMMATINALRPWAVPLDGFGTLHLDTPMKPAFKSGFGYYPIAWKVIHRVPVRPKR